MALKKSDAKEPIESTVEKAYMSVEATKNDEPQQVITTLKQTKKEPSPEIKVKEIPIIKEPTPDTKVKETPVTYEPIVIPDKEEK